MRLRFSIRTLLLLTTLASALCVALALYRQWNAVRVAKEQFALLKTAYDARLLIDDVELCHAAQKLLLVEQQLPWNDDSRSQTEYVNRLRVIEERAHSRARIARHGTKESGEAAQLRASKVTDLRHQAEMAAR